MNTVIRKVEMGTPRTVYYNGKNETLKTKGLMSCSSSPQNIMKHRKKYKVYSQKVSHLELRIKSKLGSYDPLKKGPFYFRYDFRWRSTLTLLVYSTTKFRGSGVVCHPEVIHSKGRDRKDRSSNRN